jgi:hypothetical protein
MLKSSTKSTLAVDSSLHHLEQRHRAMLTKLVDLGLVLRGSIASRLTRCGQPGCRCKAVPPVLHGPYYVWTRKVAAKTVTAQLAPDQAEYCLAWNQNMRELDRIVADLQDLGLQAAALLRQAPRETSQPRP